MRRSRKPRQSRAEPNLDRPYCRGAMVHGDLGHLEAAPRGERRDEAVELPVQADLLHHLPPVDLEARVEVVEPDAGQAARDPVEEPGRPGLGPRVLAVLLPARHEVEPVLEAGEELRDLGGIVLEVGVEGDDDRPPGPRGSRRPARRPCRSSAGAGGRGRGDPRSVSFSMQLEGAVAAPVVDEEDLVRTTEALERLGQLAVEDAQAFDLVEDRQDHRDLDLRHPGRPPPLALLQRLRAVADGRGEVEPCRCRVSYVGVRAALPRRAPGSPAPRRGARRPGRCRCSCRSRWRRRTASRPRCPGRRPAWPSSGCPGTR